MSPRPAAAPTVLAVLPLVGLLSLACGEDSHQVPQHHEPLAFLHSEGDEEIEAPGAELIPAGYHDIESVPVRLEGHDFRVATRAGDLVTGLVQAPCSQCHAPEGVTLPPGDGEAPGRPAHWQVARAHGAAPLDCASCHAPDDPARLRVPTVAAARPEEAEAADGWPIEHSYRVCGTCHFGQLRDWAGGAHGKRLAGWSGPRVVAPCTACHDPHDPGLPQRLPATFSPPPDRDDRLTEDER